MKEFSENKNEGELWGKFPYPKAVSKDWLVDIGVDKDNLKKVSDLFVNDEVELNVDNLVTLQQKAINVRLISNNLFAPLHRVSVNQETNKAWRQFLGEDRKSFERFFYHKEVKNVRQTYSRKMQIAWKDFVAGDYQDWNKYQEKLSINIKNFDNRTFYPQNEWKSEVASSRLDFRTITAKSMTEIIEGKAPIASVDTLQDFGFKTYQRDYVWATLGKEFAITRFNVKKVMDAGLSLKSLVDSEVLRSNEPTNFLRSVR